MPATSARPEAGIPQSQSYVPVPDPTALTTEQLRRELGALREVIEARLNGMDIATKLLADQASGVPKDIDKQIRHLTDLFSERMEGLKAETISLGRSIQLQFDERDIRSQASEDAAKIAVNAALQAQKEAAAAQNESNAAAITKSEGATVKQIDGILALLASNTMSMNDKITGIISRLDRGEAMLSATSVSRQDRRLDGSSNVAILGVGLTVITVVIGLIGFVMIRSAASPTPIIIQPPPSSSAPAHT
jgi:hypothetical protein